MPHIVTNGSNMLDKFLWNLVRYASICDQPQGDNMFLSEKLVANM